MVRLHHIARRVVDPLVEFFRLEAASGIVLFAAAVAALAWSNSPWGAGYRELFDPRAQLVINDGLMTVFFVLVGMEIKRELVEGELRTLSSALLPAIAALGGMAVPAILYTALNAGGPGAKGWAIPVATDIAFCIGVLRLLKGRVPNALTVFLIALAIFDDMGGVLVIALFYGHGISPLWLGVTAALVGLIVLANRLGWARWYVYLIAGVALWSAVHHSGIHATIAGVILGLLVPAKPRAGREPPIDGFIHTLHPWVAFGIMPLFALSSAGVNLHGMSLGDLVAPVPLGAALGLVAGKQIGIFAFAWGAVRLGVSSMPGNARVAQLWGVAIVGGIGFTVSLFIAGLAFAAQEALLSGAKIGVLIGSVVSGLAGYTVLRVTAPRVAE